MLKRIVATVIMSACVTSAAIAQGSGQAATENAQCTQAAHDLIQAAESKQLDDNKLDRIEDLLTKMEDLCDNDKVAEAMAVAKDIEAEINAQ
jgi:hypothetical protein